MIKKLSHACFHSPDLESTRSFYVDLLGMEVKFEFMKDDALFGYYFDAGDGSFIEVFKGTTEGSGSNGRHFCFEVESIDELIAKFEEAGMEHTGKKFGPDRSWQVWTTDPNGIPVEFQEYTDQSSKLTGQSCIADW